MTKVLVLKSSILGDFSQSARLIDEWVAKERSAGVEVTVRDLPLSRCRYWTAKSPLV